jgi:hypothetical protein
MFGIRHARRQPEREIHLIRDPDARPGETRWRIIIDNAVTINGEPQSAEYTRWRRGKPVKYYTQEDAAAQAGKLRGMYPDDRVRVEPATDPVPPSLGAMTDDCASYTPLPAIPLIEQIGRILDSR